MVFAYADPPYVGQARKHYGGVEVNHRLLVAHLVDDFPDGWALSCSTPSLRALLPLCPADVRIGAWVKPFHVFKPGVRPAYAWEPVIFRGGRNANPDVPMNGGPATTPRDWLSANISLQPRPRQGCAGAKPLAFCYWLFDLLNMRRGDTLVDLFPGSGAVTEAFLRYQERFSFEDEPTQLPLEA
jgi:hypothetical protein